MLPCVCSGGTHTGGYRHPKQGNRHAALQGVKNPRICNTGANMVFSDCIEKCMFIEYTFFNSVLLSQYGTFLT